MLAILALAELFGCSALESVIAWLRYLSHRRVRQPTTELEYRTGSALFFPRFALPLLTAVGLACAIYLAIDEQQRGQFHPESTPGVAGLVLFQSAMLAVQVVRVIAGVRRYRARPREVLQVIQRRTPTPLSE